MTGTRLRSQTKRTGRDVTLIGKASKYGMPEDEQSLTSIDQRSNSTFDMNSCAPTSVFTHSWRPNSLYSSDTVSTDSDSIVHTAFDLDPTEHAENEADNTRLLPKPPKAPKSSNSRSTFGTMLYYMRMRWRHLCTIRIESLHCFKKMKDDEEDAVLASKKVKISMMENWKKKPTADQGNDETSSEGERDHDDLMCKDPVCRLETSSTKQDSHGDSSTNDLFIQFSKTDSSLWNVLSESYNLSGSASF